MTIVRDWHYVSAGACWQTTRDEYTASAYVSDTAEHQPVLFVGMNVRGSNGWDDHVLIPMHVLKQLLKGSGYSLVSDEVINRIKQEIE